ncbi:MAG: hypothetical protein K6G64_06080 [Eubacterium sp.]|nr:hypothetical protein [Eubacterium sp.]
MRNRRNWKKVIAGIVSVTLVVGSIVFTPKKTEAAVYAEKGAFGVGQGKQIPDHVFAPFVDIASYVNDSEFAVAGSLSLEKMYRDTGILYYNLGFITATTGGSVNNGKVDWSWGGYSTISENSTDKFQLNGIKKSINYIRSKGGDVIISVGGLNEGNLFQATQDEDVLFNTYMDIVQGYGLTRLDLDIEGNGQGKQINIANAKALKRVQAATGVEIVLTLPVLPTGLTDLGRGTMEAYIENGVDVKMVNIMAMCYGSGVVYPGETYAQASVRAIDNTAQQIKTAYASIGTNISDATAYGKVGVTVSIGEESASFPIWTTDYSEVVNQKAIDSNIGMTSFWCLNRDCQHYGTNNGIYGMYEHTNAFKTFMGENAYQIPDPSEEETEAGGTVIPQWDSADVYLQGALVVHNGKVWEASWWTQNEEPGDESIPANPWKYVRDASTTPEPTTEEPTTQEPSTEEPTTEVHTNVAMEINGVQISTTLGGFRVVYSAEDNDQEIEEVGLVYGLSASDEDMVVGSNNSTVYSFPSTEEGKQKKNMSTYSNGTSYAMTMNFLRNARFYNAQIDVRAYAKLKNGGYTYSSTHHFTVFQVAQQLYERELMTNEAAHNYLYYNILKIADPNYVFHQYDLSKTVVK